MPIIFLLLLLTTVQAYTCWTNRYPLNIGDATGNTFITGVQLSGNRYFVGGHSTADVMKQGATGASQTAFVLHLTYDKIALTWGKYFYDEDVPASGNRVELYQMMLIDSNIACLVGTTTGNHNSLLMFIT